MFAADEQPSILTYLVGMIVLVMVAVGLSLVFDKRNQPTPSSIEIGQEIVLGDTEIAALTTDLKTRSAQLDRSTPALRLSSQTILELSASTETLCKRQVDLRQLRDDLRASIASVEKDFSNAQSDYRRKTWTAAVGENLGDLAVRGGEVYRRATITQVTDVGLEIRHEHGLARVQGPDLEVKLQERFQWDDDQRLNRLTQEEQVRDADLKKIAANRAPSPLESNPLTRTVSDPVSTKITDEAAGKLDGLRTNMIAWKRKIGALRSEKAQADSQATYGNRHSVPGSLETWEAKAGRLGRDLAKAQDGLERTKAKLAEISPSDLLLRDEEN